MWSIKSSHPAGLPRCQTITRNERKKVSSDFGRMGKSHDGKLILFVPYRPVVDLIHRHQKPDAPAMAANKACHQNNRGRAALIERRMASASRFRD